MPIPPHLIVNAGRVKLEVWDQVLMRGNASIKSPGVVNVLVNLTNENQTETNLSLWWKWTLDSAAFSCSSLLLYPFGWGWVLFLFPFLDFKWKQKLTWHVVVYGSKSFRSLSRSSNVENGIAKKYFGSQYKFTRNKA